MLTRIPSGSYALEDLDDTVALNLSEAVSFPFPDDAKPTVPQNPAVGLFTEGCFVLVDGIYELNSTFTVNEMAHPPSEGRKIARSIFGHLDNLGIGAVTLAEEAAYQKLEQSHPNSIVVISDLYLDLAKVLASFKQILTGYEDAAEGPTDLPCAFVLCGNFCSRPFILDGKASQVYKSTL
jgi:DNA polymerase epsilon subunit 2